MGQRTENGYIIIYCDFTGEDWDNESPMIEGHKGSIISLQALRRATQEACEASEVFSCTMCLRSFDPPEKMWRHPDPPPGANAQAVICWDCIQQADRAFGKDPEVAYDRQIPPTRRWR